MNKMDEIMLPRVTKWLVSANCWGAIAYLFVNLLGWDEDKTYCMVVGYMFLSMWNNIFYMLYRMIKG